MTDRGEARADVASKKLRAHSEMRLATAMMVDMVDSTATSERLGPEASFLLLDEVLGIARSVVAAHGGIMMEELGDGFFALFGAPISIERASLAASRAALEICDTVRIEAEAFNGRFGLAPQLRVGLAAGEVLLTRSKSEGTLRATGNTVSLAARLQALAEPNGVLCSESVALETEGWVRLDPLEPRTLKGFEAPVQSFRLREIIDGGLTKATGGARQPGGFVGRNEKIEQLTRWIDRTVDQLPVSLIVGEAGIGKSRLTAEFAARSGRRRLIVGSCHPGGTARPLAPLIEILRDYANWRTGLDMDSLTSALDPILPPEPAERDLLVGLVAGRASPEAEADASAAITLRKALSAALSALGQLPDCLMTVEDLHWIDPLSGEVLIAVVAAAPDGFRMLGTTRPVDWLDGLPRARIERVDAGPLRPDDIRAIAQAMIGEAADEALTEKLAQDSEGNPFFAIEILHNFAARGDGVEAARIGTIQNVALARFDRLGSETKALLRMASVQGRTFRFDVLARSAEVSGSRVAGLLDAAEGIVEPDPTDPAGSGRFHHILQRDSIYATIPSTARGARHHAVALSLEACTDDQAPQHADQLADHFERAGEPRDAVRYLRIAAGGAYGLYALESCTALMDRAFRLIEASVDLFSVEELENAVSIRMRCLDVMDRFRSVIETSETWLPRLRTPQGSPTLALLLALTGKAHCHLIDIDRSHQLIAEALEMATRLGHERAIAYAKVALMRVLSDSGRGSLEEIERLYEETRAFTERLSDGTLYANRMFHMIAAYRTKGMMRRANEVNEEFHDFGTRHDQHHVQVVSNWNRALSAIEANDHEMALALADRGLEGAARGSADWEIFTMLKVSTHLSLGHEVPLETMQRIHDNTDRRGEFTTRNNAATQMGYARCARGQLWRGWQQLRRSHARIYPNCQIEMQRFLLLHRAEFLLIVCGLIVIPSMRRPRLGFADLLVAIYLRLNGRRWAKDLLHRLLSQFDREEGLFVARAKAGLAVIAAAEGRPDVARRDFALAERLFQAEGLTAELERLGNMRARSGF